MLNKQLQLFVFPYAGGSIESFRSFSQLIDERIDVVIIEYAGRGTRAKEPLASSLDILLEDAINYASERRDISVPYAIFGYSMGSIFAYEVLRRQALQGKNLHTFICAEISPKERAMEFSKVEKPSDEMILNRARRLGGVDERIVKNRRFFEIYMKPMISDYKLLYEYRFQAIKDKIKTDITFFYSEADTPLKSIQTWEDLIEGKFDFFEFGNNHFFINEYYGEMAKIVNTHLLSFLE